jgi:hypothetical protein
MNEAFIGREEFPKDYLEPETVASAIVAQILSGQSAQIFLPGKLRLLSGIRGFPTWMQEKIRRQGSKVICD